MNPTHLILIDGHALAYRSYHALPPMTNASGETVHAILGFFKVLLKLARAGHPVAVAFDPPGKSFRHARSDTYKAGRAQTPDDFRAQMTHIQRLTRLTGVPVVQTPGVEADDMIATLTHQATVSGLGVTIVTTDKDAFQLLADDVSVLSGDVTVTPASLHAKYGVTAAQWVDYRALIGDASDNLPGARGVGPKTAQKLLEAHGTLDGIYAAVDAGLIPGRTGELLRGARADVQFTREMSTLLRDTDTAVDVFTPRAGSPDLVPELYRLGVGSLAADTARVFLSAQTGSETPGRDTPGPSDEPSPPDLTGSALPDMQDWPPPTGTGQWTVTFARDNDLQSPITGATLVTDTGTYAAPTSAADASPEASTDASTDLFGQVAPARKAGGRAAAPAPHVPIDTLSAVIRDGDVIDGPNAKQFAALLRVHGRHVRVGYDPLLHAHLLNAENSGGKDAAARYLNTDWPADATDQTRTAAQLSRVLRAQRPLDPVRQALHDDIERPLSSVLAGMEATGVLLDTAYFKGLHDAVAARLASLEMEIHELAGREFNVTSPRQLEAVLYDELKLASSVKTKTGRSVNAAALEPLLGAHPIVGHVLEHRELSKLSGTYLDPLPKMLHPLTGRLHTTFTQTSVSTGRLSSVNPNLQNIPVRSQIGREIRRGFIAAPGYVFVSADYSQIELRILADICEDPALRQAFLDDVDIHRRTAAQMLGVPEEQVSSDARRAAKTINFGVLYGMSAHRLARELGVPHAQAQEFITRYFGAYPGIQAYMDRTLASGRSLGYVETRYGRRRYLPELNASNRVVRESGERNAINMPIQGTAADIIKVAMLRLHAELPRLGARMLLQVHDELLIEAPEDRAGEALALTREVMEGAVTLSVPLRVEGSTGPTWYDSK